MVWTTFDIICPNLDGGSFPDAYITELFMIYQYWLHVEQFPHLRPIDDGFLEELDGILAHSVISKQWW